MKKVIISIFLLLVLLLITLSGLFYYLIIKQEPYEMVQNYIVTPLPHSLTNLHMDYTHSFREWNAIIKFQINTNDFRKIVSTKNYHNIYDKFIRDKLSIFRKNPWIDMDTYSVDEAYTYLDEENGVILSMVTSKSSNGYLNVLINISRY